MPDNRDSCWSQSQKVKDPFLKAWIDDIPATTLSKAVWEYNRNEVAFKPYRWDGYKVSPNLPAFLIDNVFMQIAGLRTPHPLNRANMFALKWLFCFHLPVICILTVVYLRCVEVFSGKTKPANILWYPVTIVAMSVIFIVLVINKVK